MTLPNSAAAETGEVEQPTFDILPLSPAVRRAVDELGYTNPTPVQRAVFESASAGKDLVVQARTGTGKTAAFGLPVVDRLIDVDQKATQVLVLSPTRELALQISRELEGLAKHNGVMCTAVYGGASMQPQIDAIRQGAQVIAGTPGRVLDHLERGTLKAKTIRVLVLDESDEMLSMGFLPQITKIMEHLPEQRQILLFSATLPPDVRRIAETRLKDPEFITLSGDHIGALSIDHYVYRSAGNKSDELVQVLDIENPESAIIFCNTRDQTKRISAALNRKGYAADWLNADLAQNDREKVMRATREGKLRFLVCTDVAARGIDISHLTHVINADFPDSTENYVHRTGRTGRAGKTGTAISLITPQDVGNLYILRLTYKIFPVERDLPSAGDLQTRKESDLVEFLYQAFQGQVLSPGDLSLARRILSSDVAERILAGLLRDHLGGRPQLSEEATQDRRESVAAPVTSENQEERAFKKKSDKAGKRDKEKDRKSETDDESSPPRSDKRKSSKEKDRDKKKKTDPQGEDARGKGEKAEAQDRSKRDKKHKKHREEDSRENRPASQNQRLQDGLEIISAADLLDADELSFLNEGSERASTKPRFVKADQEPAPKKSESSRIFVDVGNRDDVEKDDFFDTLDDNGFPSQEVLEMNIRDTHSFLVVPTQLLQQALSALDGKLVAGLEVMAEQARPRNPRA